MIWRRRKPKSRKLTGVSASLTASHRDPRDGNVHEHTWEITAWFDYSSVDARVRLFLLEDVLKPYQGTCLPDRIAWGEHLAEHVAVSINGWGYEYRAVVAAVDVARPDERIFARWEAA